MKIGNIEFGDRPLFLAPMEDVTDIGFRKLCKRFGASMVYTEFVSAEALVRSIKSTVSKLTISDDERPVGIQIYGRDTEAMVEAAKIVEEAHPDVIDLNFGCPVKKVAGKGAGAGMLQNIPLMLDITREVVKAVHTPVTVKTRLGWDSSHLIITDLAEQLQDCGIQALTIHGRTRAQMYTGSADWTPSLATATSRHPRMPSALSTTTAWMPLWWDAPPSDARGYSRRCATISTDVRRTSRSTSTARLTYSKNSSASTWNASTSTARRHLAATPIFKGIPDFRQTRIAMLRATTVEELTAILEDCRRRLGAQQ